MRRPLIAAVLALAVAVSTACDDNRAQFGLTLSPAGDLEVLHKPCRTSTRVHDLYVEPKGELRPLWHISSDGRSETRTFVIGEAPPGFVEVVPLTEPLPSTIVVAITTEPDGRLKGSVDAEQIKLSDIRSGTIFVPGRGQVHEDEFERLSTCD